LINFLGIIMSQLKKTLLGSIAPLMLSGMLIAQVAPVNASEADQKQYARFTQDNELLTPRNYREWMFIGAQVTPKDMNDGKPAFPEFHNVYIDPVSWAHWKKTGEFRDGTIIVKELTGVGAKQSASGKTGTSRAILMVSLQR
jgi:hypothetical protein